MITEIAKINGDKGDFSIYKKAAEIIVGGGLVAFPTETVYGLGANALDPVAVKKIYAAKGRPSDNPLIVHIASVSQLDTVADNISEKAKKLIDNFWPGPLTIIFRKKELVPFETSGGLDTVAVRFPENKTAQSFIKNCGLPVAAPSANTSGRPSPTSAAHVIADLGGRIDMIIDGGNSVFGLESTIVDASGENITLLRPGSVTPEMLSAIIGNVDTDKTIFEKPNKDLRPLAPGMKYKHYSPSCKITVITGGENKVKSEILRLALKGDRSRTGIIATLEDKSYFEGSGCHILTMGAFKAPETVASALFETLRQCDVLGLDRAYVRGFPEEGVFLAVMNRLKKAAGYDIINVG